MVFWEYWDRSRWVLGILGHILMGSGNTGTDPSGPVEHQKIQLLLPLSVSLLALSGGGSHSETNAKVAHSSEMADESRGQENVQHLSTIQT